MGKNIDGLRIFCHICYSILLSCGWTAFAKNTWAKKFPESITHLNRCGMKREPRSEKRKSSAIILYRIRSFQVHYICDTISILPIHMQMKSRLKPSFRIRGSEIEPYILASLSPRCSERVLACWEPQGPHQHRGKASLSSFRYPDTCIGIYQ